MEFVEMSAAKKLLLSDFQYIYSHAMIEHLNKHGLFLT